MLSGGAGICNVSISVNQLMDFERCSDDFMRFLFNFEFVFVAIAYFFVVLGSSAGKLKTLIFFGNFFKVLLQLIVCLISKISKIDLKDFFQIYCNLILDKKLWQNISKKFGTLVWIIRSMQSIQLISPTCSYLALILLEVL